MGLLEQEIKELRQLRSDLKSGKVSDEHAMIEIQIFKETGNRARMLLSAHALAAKFGKNIFNRVVRSNLIGDGTAIDAGDHEIEMVKCPDQEKQITRADCLSFSGTNTETCRSCPNFKPTRDLLLPKK